MNRIALKFEQLAREGRKGLIGYMTAGDPDRLASERHMRAAIAGGLDILELGMPFSDATADGPVIQEASQRALAAGMTVEGALRLAAGLRRDHDLPIVLFGYANPFFRYGFDRLAADAAAAGVDGMLVVDLPFEESDELRAHLEKNGLCFIDLIAPTTPTQRAAIVLKNATGFVYYIMVTGVTGARARLADDVRSHVERLRGCTSLPIAVGFGVSSGEQAREAANTADAVIVGSALVRAAHSGTAGEFVAELKRSMAAPGSHRRRQG